MDDLKIIDALTRMPADEITQFRATARRLASDCATNTGISAVYEALANVGHDGDLRAVADTLGQLTPAEHDALGGPVLRLLKANPAGEEAWRRFRRLALNMRDIRFSAGRRA